MKQLAKYIHGMEHRYALCSTWMISLLITVTHLSAQEIRELQPGDTAGKATLAEVAWLTGYWEGEGFGGDCTELWLPPVDNAMQGIFRFVLQDTLIFTEYMHVFAEDSTLFIKLKHFNRDLTGWEEQAEWTIFPLVAVEGQTAYFDGLTYMRSENKLIIKLKLVDNGAIFEETFAFERKEL